MFVVVITGIKVGIVYPSKVVDSSNTGRDSMWRSLKKLKGTEMRRQALIIDSSTQAHIYRALVPVTESAKYLGRRRLQRRQSKDIYPIFKLKR
jgi:hypothetical protein